MGMKVVQTDGCPPPTPPSPLGAGQVAKKQETKNPPTHTTTNISRRWCEEPDTRRDTKPGQTAKAKEALHRGKHKPGEHDGDTALAKLLELDVDLQASTMTPPPRRTSTKKLRHEHPPSFRGTRGAKREREREGER